MRYRFVTADVFTDRTFGGNALAVLPNARGLDDGRMQAIAREFNISETVFVLPPENAAHTRRLRIFTPTSELPFAGHPTVGTALLLAMLGEIELSGPSTQIVFEEGAGPVPVEIEAGGGRASFAWLSAPRMPEFQSVPDMDVIAPLLALGSEDLIAEAGLPQAVSCGAAFLIVQLRDREALGRARLDRSLWEQHLKGRWADKVYVFAEDAPAGFDFQARMFAPGEGIEEDPATGAATAAFGGWLGDRRARTDGVHRWSIAQGIEMGRPSRLAVEVVRQGGRLEVVRVGGGAVPVMEGTLEIPQP